MRAQVIVREALSTVDRDSMRALLNTQFEGVTRQSFDDDLGDKNWVIIIRSEDDQIQAFSTIHLYSTDIEGKPVWVLFSGDTVVSPSCWNSRSLAQAWWPGVLALQRRYCAKPLYWLLISSGYRTYRYLPALAQRFYPTCREETPMEESRLLCTLASRRFGNRFIPSTGIVRLEKPNPLRPAFRGIPAERMLDPHIAYFAQRNPGFEQGDELVCIAQIAPDNLTSLGRRLAARSMDCEIVEDFRA